MSFLPYRNALSQGPGSGGAPAGPPQPDFNNVEFLSDCEGADGQTNLTEQSNNAFASIGFNGGAEISNAQAQFGTTSFASLTTVGNNQMIFAYNANLNPGSSDFCWETGVRFASSVVGRNACIVSNRNDLGAFPSHSYYWQIFDNGGTPELQFVGSNAAGTASIVVASFPWTPAIDTWYHVAIVRSGNNCEMFVDGVSIGSNAGFAGAASTIFDTAGFTNLKFGIDLIGSGGVAQLDGWLDNLRLTIGEPLYTAPFTPPTGPHPTS
jgi:hypothetical protein